MFDTGARKKIQEGARLKKKENLFLPKRFGLKQAHSVNTLRGQKKKNAVISCLKRLNL